MKQLTFLAFALVFFSCVTRDEAVSTPKTDAKCAVSDFGNDVYYFTCENSDGSAEGNRRVNSGEDLGKALSTFRFSHPELDIVSVTGNGRGYSGYDLGYFVLCRKKPQ